MKDGTLGAPDGAPLEAHNMNDHAERGPGTVTPLVRPIVGYIRGRPVSQSGGKSYRRTAAGPLGIEDGATYRYEDAQGGYTWLSDRQLFNGELVKANIPPCVNETKGPGLQ